MKNLLKLSTFCIFLLIVSCTSQGNTESSESANNKASVAGQSAVQDNASNPNIVQVALESKDHTTLVTAVKTAELVDVLSNAGPFTVFAPTNEAFAKLPAGTVEGLLKAEKKETLTDILQYHVSVGVYKAESLKDGQILGQVNGGNIKVTIVGGKILINGKAHIIASVPASNGIIHIIDEVLLPAQ